MCSLSEQFAVVLSKLRRVMAADPDYKVIVFFTTVSQTQLFTELFNRLSDIKVRAPRLRKEALPSLLMLDWPRATHTPPSRAEPSPSLRHQVMEIHSRKSQPQRTRISDEFRKVKRGILFSSDVSARGGNGRRPPKNRPLKTLASRPQIQPYSHPCPSLFSSFLFSPLPGRP